VLRFVVRRLLLLAPILLGLSIAIFAWVHALPGSPATSLLGERATPELVKSYNEKYGFERSIPEQYWGYIKATAGGELGTSITTHRTVTSELRERPCAERDFVGRVGTSALEDRWLYGAADQVDGRPRDRPAVDEHAVGECDRRVAVDEGIRL